MHIKITADFMNLDRLCTDSAPTAVCKNLELFSLLKKSLKGPTLEYLCITHNDSLHGKSLNHTHVMGTLVKCVHTIVANSLFC